MLHMSRTMATRRQFLRALMVVSDLPERRPSWLTRSGLGVAEMES